MGDRRAAVSPHARVGGWLAGAALVLALAPGCSRPEGEAPVRVGCFPNVTHGQALAGRSLGWFDREVGTRIDWKTFNAGPSAMEALLTGALDLAYVGPNPAVNAYVRSKSGALKVVAGVTSGGASLVVRDASGIAQPGDLRGRRVASPQLGNTQDVALRHWLHAHGMESAEKGGDVHVLPVQNPDTLTLFIRGDLDAAWVPEPWGARLVKEGGGRILVDERDLWEGGRFCTALLVARSGFLETRRDVAERFVAAHVKVTEWMAGNPEDARRLVNEQFAKLTGKRLAEDVIASAFSRMEATYDPLATTVARSGRQAWELGYLPGEEAPDLAGLFDLSLLNAALRREGRAEIGVP
jgi:NitT/TauT family transport system substrate-binding protein